MAVFTEEALRARQVELKDELNKIRAVTIPMREARDKFVQDTDAKRRELDAELLAAEAPLSELQKEAAMIARALGGKSLNG